MDLNGLLYHLETTLARAQRLDRDETGARAMTAQAERRREAINEVFWSEKDGWYVDYDLTAKRRSTERHWRE